MKKKLYFVFLTTLIQTARAEPVMITDPTYPGTQIPFVYASWACPESDACRTGDSFDPPRESWNLAEFFLNETGVCRALGYQKAIANSSYSYSGSNDLPRFSMFSDGRIAGTAAGPSLNGITCDEPIENFKPVKLVQIDFPVDPKTKRPITYPAGYQLYMCALDEGIASDSDATCRLLGYTSAVKWSAFRRRQCVSNIETMVVKKNGRRKRLKQKTLRMPSIICTDENGESRL